MYAGKDGVFRLSKIDDRYQINLPTELVERFGWKVDDEMHMMVIPAGSESITIQKVTIPKKQLKDIREYIEKAASE